jgi:putative membrane protein
VLLADEQSQIGNTGNTAAAQTAAGRQMSQQDQTAHFFKEAASGNEFEVRLADLAMQRSQNAQVKELAQHIKQDHTQANQVLKQMAQQGNVDVSSGDLMPVHQAMLQEMQQKQGEQFDRAFVFGNTADHQKDILMYSYFANKGTGPAQQYARQILPKLQQHYQQMQPIAQQMAGSTMAVGTSSMDHGHMAQPAAGSVGGTTIDTSRTTGTSSGSTGASGSMTTGGSSNKTSEERHNVGTDRNGPNESGVAGQNTSPQREIDRDNQSSPNKMGVSTGENR